MGSNHYLRNVNKHKEQRHISLFICQRPIHPGELIKEELEYRNVRQNKFAEQMGISSKVLNDILNWIATSLYSL